MQVENEYGSFDLKSKQYLEFLYNLYEVHGITGESLMFTSDGVNMGYTGTLPDKLFMTANFASYPSDNFNKLKKLQPNKPVMAMELWSGWCLLLHDGQEHILRKFNFVLSVFTGSIIGRKRIIPPM